VGSGGFWALIAVLVIALSAVALAIVRWRLRSGPAALSAPDGDDTSRWLASEKHSKMAEMCLDCDNPLWDSDHDVTSAIPEVTRQEDELL
jgi:hypothetical protein